MCGRYTAVADLREVVTTLGVEQVLAAAEAPQYNIAPTQPISVVRQFESVRQLDLFSWGLKLNWTNSSLTPSTLINARVESVTQKPSFREAAKFRRCLIPASGWYEWQSTVLTAGKKQPYYFYSNESPLLAFAGIYEITESGEFSAAIITQDANEIVGSIHDRMPLILSSQYFADWLDPSLTDSSEIVATVRTATPPSLQCHAVTTEVNSARAQGAHLISPADPEPTQPALFD